MITSAAITNGPRHPVVLANYAAVDRVHRCGEQARRHHARVRVLGALLTLGSAPARCAGGPAMPIAVGSAKPTSRDACPFTIGQPAFTVVVAGTVNLLSPDTDGRWGGTAGSEGRGTSAAGVSWVVDRPVWQRGASYVVGDELADGHDAVPAT